METPSQLNFVNGLRFMEPARGEICPAGKHRGRTAPEEDKFPSPGRTSFHISTTPTTRECKRRSLGSIPPRIVWKSQPNWIYVNWLKLMEPSRGEICPAGQHRGRAAAEEDEFPSPVRTSFHISTTPTTRGCKLRTPGSIPPRKVWKPQPNCLLGNWLRLIELARGDSFHSG